MCFFKMFLKDQSNGFIEKKRKINVTLFYYYNFVWTKQIEVNREGITLKHIRQSISE